MFLSRGDRDLGVAFQTHPGRQAFISSGSKEARSALESRRVSLGAHWVDSRESSLLRRLERGREMANLLREIYLPLGGGSYYRQPCAIPQPDRATIPPPLIVTSANSAEIIKHASNAFLAMKISFVNAVASVCESVGANVEQVCEGLGTDSRIGRRFLYPGVGYGGSCFPKDLLAFRAVARDCGYDFSLLDEVIRINEDMRQRFLRKVRHALWTLKGKRLAVLGLAFKGGTDDVRESPALALVELLLKEGSQVAAYDPAATERARETLGERVKFAANVYDAARGADA